jgi:hypothetical protein
MSEFTARSFPVYMYDKEMNCSIISMGEVCGPHGDKTLSLSRLPSVGLNNLHMLIMHRSYFPILSDQRTLSISESRRSGVLLCMYRLFDV